MVLKTLRRVLGMMLRTVIVYISVCIMNMFCLERIYLNNIMFIFMFVIITNLFKNYINFNKLVYVYLKLLFILFFFSIFVQIKCYHQKIFYSTSIDYTAIINNTTFTLFSFKATGLSCAFSTVTVQIAFFVNIYSFYYNKDEFNDYRFFFLLNLFFTSMVMLLHSNNFVSLFLFWELIGISSFFLINFHHYKTITIKSAYKAMSFNKLSDISIICAAVIYYNATNTLVFDPNLFDFFISKSTSCKFFFFLPQASVFIFFILVASFIKSAQIGFHFWLPDSMEAPLPASALIHSATLVAVGIYMVLKFNVFLHTYIYLYKITIIIFSFTYVFGAIVSAAQTDIKKLLAYSTISNCGLMFLAATLGTYENALLFFTIHGYWKSFSFLLAGQIVIMARHAQDMRFFQNKTYVNLIQISCFLIAAVGLVSFFFVGKSFIKHFIFINNTWSVFVRYTIILGSFFSFSYCIKMIFMFSGEIIKFKYVEYSFNIYVVYNILVYAILIFLNYIACYFGYVDLINLNFIFSILTVISVSSILVYLDFKKIFIITNFYW